MSPLRLSAVALLAALTLPASASASVLEFAEDVDPTVIAAGEDGRISVANEGGLLVHRYSGAGAALGAFGGFGTGQGRFGSPFALETRGSDDHLFVADLAYENLPVQEFDADGTFVRSFGTAQQGQSLDVAATDSAVYVLRTGGTVQTYPAAGGAEIGSAWATGTGNQSASMVLNPANGHLYVAGAMSREVREFQTDGTLVRSWTVAGQVGKLVDGIAADADGAIYTVEESIIRRHDATGTPTGTAPLGGRDLDVVDGHLHLATGQSARRVEVGAPIVELARASGVVQPGQAVALTATTLVPFGTVQRHEWDLDGNGSFETDTGATASASARFATPGSRTVGVRVTSASGKSAERTLKVDVVAPAPPSGGGEAPGPGAPTGPTPPAGPVGVSINDGARYTNDPGVTVNVVWPLGATSLTIANDGGFRQARAIPVAARIPWQLDSSGPERLPKTIYVRFGGTQTFQDDIILDETDPVIASAVVSGGSARGARAAAAKTTIRVNAKDATSGVATMQFAVKKARPAKARAYRKSVKVRGPKPRFVRVTDRAGNTSGWKTLKTRNR